MATKAWEAVAPLATARQGHGVGVLGGKLYAVGGQSVGVSLSSVERYDPAVDVWEAVAPMASERDNCGVAVLDGSLYAVGGGTATAAAAPPARWSGTTLRRTRGRH